MKKCFIPQWYLLITTTSFLFLGNLCAQDNVLTVDWNTVATVSKTTATLQVVENPMVRSGSSIHKNTFKALKDLGADYVRYVPWFPYAKMAVAELKPPTKTETFWDFTYLDSTMEAIMKATEGHPAVINFSTIPAWMWKIDSAIKYPDDAYQVFWDYNQGTVLRDTTMKEVAGYYARLFSWYTKGGFTDESGKFHQSNHFYKIPYWEILNEPDLEHNISVEVYTKMYDAIVTEIKKISPSTKFVGISLAFNGRPEYFEYFLNQKNHKPGIPLDGISYHFYGTPSYHDQTLEDYQYTFFDKANAFLEKVRFIENLRKRLSPKTITTINEIGTIIGAA
ncbi:MAG: glycosyl hydrolase family 39, partial [Panacibacter sp.]